MPARLICLNGLVCGETVTDVRVRHKGQIVDNVIEGAFKVLDGFKLVRMGRDDMRVITLAPADAATFVRAALALKYEPLARRIYESNTQMLRRADGVLADLQEWRGNEPDSGTAFKVGFAAALELPAVAYGAPVDCYADRVSKTRACERDALGMLRERDSQMAVEDFGMPLNLMLGCSTVLVNSEEEGIAMLAAMLRHGSDSSRKGTFDNWLQARVLDYNARKVAG